MRDALRDRVQTGAAPRDDELTRLVDAASRAGGALLGPVALAETVRAVADELLGAGPLQRWLDDPAVTDVLVNGPRDVWVERAGRLAHVDVDLGSPAEVRALAVRLAAAAGRRLDDAASEVARVDVVVSTLPAHAADPLADLLPEAVAGVLLDVCYDPRPTALGAAWARRGGTVVGGERMLLHQAAEQVRLMTGHVAPVAAMDEALRSALVPA
ncbi:hypothetical protein [Cellulomonas sp. B6]|uniref:hypothetical protein n=1 Tax=Cellulomonas sp. B6 TaxID=1295626 RepID=UPI00350FA7F3